IVERPDRNSTRRPRNLLSNKRATGNILIHKLLLISILRKKISALSRPVHGFESRTVPCAHFLHIRLSQNLYSAYETKRSAPERSLTCSSENRCIQRRRQ